MMRGIRYKWLQSVLIAQALVACASDAPVTIDAVETVGVNLALNVSTSHQTRMANEIVQLPNGTAAFRGLGEVHAIAYGVKGRKIEATDDPLLNRVDDLTETGDKTSNRYYNYWCANTLEVPVSTASFLCYASANPVMSGGIKDKAVNGSIATTAFEGARKATKDLKFSPDPIYSDPTAHETATIIADFLSELAGITYGANSTRWCDFSEETDPALEMLFQSFSNNGQPMAGSSANVQCLIEALKSTVNKMDDAHAAFKEAVMAKINSFPVPAGFPATIGLPDGAAVVQWNSSSSKFEVMTNATTVTPMTSQNRFVYPAELYYYANSQIFVSNKEKSKEDYKAIDPWTEENLRINFESENGVVSSNTKSVAITEPLRYAVGCLEANVQVSTSTSSLLDAKDMAVPLVNGSLPSFPLTGLLVSGQFQQDFEFKPIDIDMTEYVIYDHHLGDISLSTTTSDDFHTLVFQSKKSDEPIMVALEFQNNSGKDFRGVNGIVYQGTKFYLVGKIDLDQIVRPSPQIEDLDKRVFTKNYITKIPMKVASLSKAYNVVPDLISARLEIGVQLTPTWIEATPTNVPLN